MTRFSLRNSVYYLLFIGLLTGTCSSQVMSGPSKYANQKSNPSPIVIGLPQSLASKPNIDTSLVSQYIRSIFQDSKGNMWFGPAGQSVAKYDGKSLRYFSKSEFFQGKNRADDNFNSVHAIAEDKHGNIWFGTDYGAIKYNGKTFRNYAENDGLSNIRVGRKCILVDKSGTIWVGTDGGVFRYIPSADSSGGKCFSLFPLLPRVRVTDIMEDRAGNIWFASHDKGVFCYDGVSIKNITGKEGLGDNYAGGMIQDKKGNYWFTMKGGICRYDGKILTEFTTKDGVGGSEVWGVFMEKSGMIWITARGSTTRYDPSIGISNPKAWTVFSEKDGINCCVQSMYQDKSGKMWWGAGAGLYRFDGKRFYQVKKNGPW